MLALGPNAIDCWFLRPDEVDLNDEYVKRLLLFLDDGELERFHRFKFDRHRKQFALAHAFMRQALSYYAPIAPESWCFTKNQYGKPFVANDLCDNLFFNLSHTNGLMALAISHNEPLGIDVEFRDSKVKGPKIADRFFSEQEVASLLSLDVSFQAHRFFDYWSLKESYIKACGKGLAIPLGDFSFALDRAEIGFTTAESLNDDPDSWVFSLLNLGDAHAVALACGAAITGFNLSCRTLVPLGQPVRIDVARRDPRHLSSL